jgi:murein L,D-transpeptidase YcbB/YkuD
MAPASARGDEQLRQYLESLDAGGPPTLAGATLRNPVQLSRFYRARDHRPVWAPRGPLTITELRTTIADASLHGLPGESYHRALLDAAAGLPDLARELLATDAFLTQARHRSAGAVAPRDLDPDWNLPPVESDGVMLLEQVLAGADLRSALDSLWPQADDYRRLVAERARLDAMDSPLSLPVPPGPIMRAGDSGARVRLLRQRLLGPGAEGDAFDADLEEAVRQFQASAAIDSDGVVGPATIELLNDNRVAWLDRIDANLERWRWLPAELPRTLLRVNIAAFTLRAIVEGEDALRMNIIAGRPYRKTPVFMENMTYLVLNPYWNVPFRLATRDKLPRLQQDPGALEREGYEARPAGSDSFVSVTSIDWSGTTPSSFGFQLRQRPGAANALGRVKFMLPNPWAIYLHDTPERELFRRAERGFSSGCIRVEDPLLLAEWLLERDGQAAAAREVRSLVAAGETRTLHLRVPLPTLITYFTAFADDDGRILYRRDIYRRDAAVTSALRGR